MKFSTWDINLKVRLFGEALLDISFWMVFPFLTIYFSESIGRELTSLLLIISQVLAVFTALLGGYFADNFGRKRMMSISVIGEGFGFLVFAIGALHVVDSPYLSFAGFAIASVFMAFYQPASQAMIADVVPPEHRTHIYSVFYMMINIAVVIGPILGYFIILRQKRYLQLFARIYYYSFYCKNLVMKQHHFWLILIYKKRLFGKVSALF
ncbi:Uncharacterized MFS-type transporter yqjV [Listeria monocytogenes N53-1]|nr:Uncharacterized MFS-type transporter yqjV [Listeria monocytogenes]CCQ24338.1 Uncharacterized MFS-type transporter yqjV [Listeria monocytogenes N53-1]